VEYLKRPLLPLRLTLNGFSKRLGSGHARMAIPQMDPPLAGQLTQKFAQSLAFSEIPLLTTAKISISVKAAHVGLMGFAKIAVSVFQLQDIHARATKVLKLG
jgi:hypothetical protein